MVRFSNTSGQMLHIWILIFLIYGRWIMQLWTGVFLYVPSVETSFSWLWLTRLIIIGIIIMEMIISYVYKSANLIDVCYIHAVATVPSDGMIHFGWIGIATAACHISLLSTDRVTPATRHLIGSNPIESTFVLRGWKSKASWSTKTANLCDPAWPMCTWNVTLIYRQVTSETTAFTQGQFKICPHNTA